MISAQQKKWFAAACAGIFGFGLVVGFLGPLFPSAKFQRLVGGDSARQGSLAAILYIGFLLATPFVGPIIDRFGNRPVLATSALVSALSLSAFSLLTSYSQALVVAVVLGLGGGGLNIASNALTADVFGDERGRYLNYLGIFFGVGFFFVPALVLLSGQDATTAVILCTASLPLLFAIAFAVMMFPAARHAQGFSVGDALRVATYPGVMLFAFALFFESGAEATVGQWNPTFAAYLGAGPTRSSWSSVAYIVSVMVSRVIAGRALRRISNTQWLIVCGITGAAACVAMALAHSFAVFLVGCALVGVTTGSIYPTMLAVAGDRYERFAATVFSLIFTVALAGGWVFPKVAGEVAKQRGMHAAMFLPFVAVAAVALFTLAIRHSERRLSASAAPHDPA